MQIRLLTFICALLALSLSAPASIIFRPGEKAKFLAPGEEEVNGNAQQLNTIAQEAEQKGNLKRAVSAYTKVWRKYPKDTLAAPAAYRAGQVLEELRDYQKAASEYRVLVERYPNSPHFEEAIEAQFRIGELYLGGKKIRVLGIPVATSMDRAVEIFAGIVRTAPYGRYTARAQFDIGLARQKQAANDAAVQAYQAVIDKFPNDPIAADAQYQLGYIWFEAARLGTNDQAAIDNARTGFEDFLNRYPKSEKAAQARENLARLEQKNTNDALKVAKYYDKRKQPRAAFIYYNEVIREQPNSIAGDQAKKRADQLRAKYGDKALQPEIAVAAKRKTVAARGSSSSSSHPALRGGDSEVAPLPPPEQDAALPPPASLAPPNTTAPDPSPAPFPPAESDPSASPGASPNP